MDNLLQVEEEVTSDWKKILPFLNELPKHFYNIVLKLYLMESLDSVFVLSRENKTAAEYLWNAIGENLLRLKGDYSEMKIAVDRIKDEAYTLSEIYSNVSKYISKRMTGQICYDIEDNREYREVINRLDYLFDYGCEYQNVFGFVSDHDYDLTNTVLKEVCEK